MFRYSSRKVLSRQRRTSIPVSKYLIDKILNFKSTVSTDSTFAPLHWSKQNPAGESFLPRRLLQLIQSSPRYFIIVNTSNVRREIYCKARHLDSVVVSVFLFNFNKYCTNPPRAGVKSAPILQANIIILQKKC